MIGRKVIDRGGFVEEPKSWRSRGSSSFLDFDTDGACGQFPPPSLADFPRISQETIDIYEMVRTGVTELMQKYTVKVCGYCPEDAIVGEVFPFNYVWHAQDPKGPPLRSALKRFYGKTSSVVEVCMQAGAQIPERYKPMMRLDIIVPDCEEEGLVA
ncbi:hypothetical protein LWI28_024022 [Acer negundo]|uniref:Uncharacterized protein n=1 Tax=Acer negundo TaxID=4023 RepID=A0AAD5NKB0_ACENE|nr:hypothetical protein LWI28_024022 [Acer negundo]KAK4856393.1 hypothetical protein QYF36_017032 [Acer negundo]